MKRTLTCSLTILLGALALLLVTTAARADPAAQKLYAEKCQMCHGPEGKGETPLGKQLGVEDWTKEGSSLEKMSKAEMVRIIRKGVTEDGKMKMPGFPDLSDPEVQALIDRVETFKPKP